MTPTDSNQDVVAWVHQTHDTIIRQQQYSVSVRSSYLVGTNHNRELLYVSIYTGTTVYVNIRTVWV